MAKINKKEKSVVTEKEYKLNILDDIFDDNNFADVKLASKLDYLRYEANTMFNKNTVEGYISSMIIYHQLIEEMIKMLINFSSNHIQLKIFPYKIEKRNLKGKLFKNLLEEFKKLLLTPKIELFIDKSYKFNELRNITVHRSITVKSVKSTFIQCKKVKKLFGEIFDLYVDISNEFIELWKSGDLIEAIKISLGINDKTIKNKVKDA